MYVKVEVNDYWALKDMLWGSNCEYTCNKIEEAGLTDEFFDHIEELFSDDTYETVSINDYIAYEFDETEFIEEHMTLNDVGSLEELKGYMEDDARITIDEAIENGNDKFLWEYLQDNFSGDSLKEVADELNNLKAIDYVPFDSVKSLDDLIEFAKENNNHTVLDIIDEVKELNLTEEFWERLEEEYKGVNYTVKNTLEDLEEFEIDSL